jgi:hypothetical protein
VQLLIGLTSSGHPLAPLIVLAREKSPSEQQQWLAMLRVDAPTLVALMEQLLGARSILTSPAQATPLPDHGGRVAERALRWGGNV